MIFAVLLTTICALKITGNLMIPIPFEPIMIKLNSISMEYSTYANHNASFQFFMNEPKSTLILQVQSVEYEFMNVRIQVDNDKIEAFEHPLGSDLATFGNQIGYPLELLPIRKFNTNRDNSNSGGGIIGKVIGMLGNPMILMSLLTMGIMFVLPKMQEMMDDPELKQELEKRGGTKSEVPDISAKWKSIQD